MQMLNRYMLCIAALAFTISIQAQQAVTTSGGAANTVPVFTGSSSVGNSVITQSNGLVGIGTSTPHDVLEVYGQLHSTLSGNTGGAVVLENTAKTTNGTAARWEIFNMSGIYGNSLQFWDYDNIGCGNPGAMCNPRLTITDAGGVGIGTTSPQESLDVWGAVRSTESSNEGGTFVLSNPAKTTNGTASAWRIYNMTGGYGDSLQFWAYDNQGCTTPGALCASRLTIADNGNIGIGTTSPGTKLEVTGSVKLTAGTGATLTFSDGTTQSTAWTGALCGGDYAESVDVSGDRAHYQPGDVLVIDDARPGSFLKSTQPYSNAIAGVYSTKPGVVGRRQTTTKNPDEVPMAIIGIVPVKVTAENGPIRPHDLLVSSSRAGYAMKGTDPSRMLGTVVGKALGSLNTGTGVIEVLVNVQ